MDWTLLSTAPGACAHPGELPSAGWRSAPVPGTVAQALDADLDAPCELDGLDWWYRCQIEAGGADQQLRFEGLATLCEVWLDGERVLSTRNMHRSYVVAGVGEGSHELVLAFRSLDAALGLRRPRPRWKTALVQSQRLRWQRTSLAGRIPGWTPLLPPIGPWREVVVEDAPLLKDVKLQTRLEDGVGVVELSALGSARDAYLDVGGDRVALGADGERLVGTLRIDGVEPWWPHTHGSPSLHRAHVELDGAVIELGDVGFRSVVFEDGELRVNGRRVFCRGACWTVEDVRSLDGTLEDLERSLEQARGFGLNMIRVGGTTTYGRPEFYALCDRLGLLVWQDFMFANLDYPLDDEELRAEVDAEVVGVLGRLSRHACVAVYCGGSEIAQQAAMLGVPDALHAWFSEDLPAHCAQGHPGVPYVANTPLGGPVPFQTRVGVTHYFGVGAYRRPLSDVRRAGVRFAAECLGLSNVPGEAGTLDVLGVPTPQPHHPAWKAGVPRDRNAGWDFEDIRDHYLRELFGVDPVELRSTDIERYLALSRAVSGELMKRVFAEWRRPGSGCGGGLVWLYRDLRAGAGCGLFDEAGRPKPVAFALRRAWARRAVLLTNEGLDGLDVHVINEHDTVLDGVVELELLKAGRHRVGLASAPVRLEPFASCTLQGDAMTEGFADLAYAYRFGPPRQDVVIARLLVDDSVVHQDVCFPVGHSLPQLSDEIEARAEQKPGGVELTLRAEVFLHTVSLSSRGYEASDDFFHLSPGREKTVFFSPVGKGRSFRVHVRALNLERVVTVRG